jgi:hypothetical protein
MTQIEALKLALDALGPTPPDCCGCQTEWQIAISAIKGALEAPQQTWGGLTDKEIEAIWKIAMFADYGIGAELSNQPFVHYARAIEAKLKEKNNE